MQQFCFTGAYNLRMTDSSPPKSVIPWGIWVTQSIGSPTSAQVMISWLVSSSPASGSVVTAQSLEPALDSVSPSLCAPSLLMRARARSLCQK